MANRERFPDCLIVEFRVTQVRGHRVFVAGFVPEDDFSSLRVAEVVKELGLLTCERGEFGQGARLLIWRRRRVCLPWRRPHGGRGSGQSTGRSGKRRARDRRERRKGTRGGTESQRTNAQPLIMDDHGDDMTRSCRLLSHDVSVHHSVCALCRRKITCEVYLSTREAISQTRACQFPFFLELTLHLVIQCWRDLRVMASFDSRIVSETVFFSQKGSPCVMQRASPCT